MSLALANHVLVQIEDAGHLRALAGLRLRRFDFASRPAERLHFATHRWRHLQPASGALEMRLAGDGLLAQAEDDRLIQKLFCDGADAKLRILMPEFGAFSGRFQLTELAYEARDFEPVVWRMAMQSNGEVDFAVA